MSREEKVPPSRKNASKPSMKIAATAKLGATAKYEVSKRIIEHIPEDVTRAKSGAWLTMLSPFTHWAGLIGDKLAHKRELLRIQQDETLTKIMLQAAPQLALLKTPTKPLPAKFLVPFLECASLEDPDSELVKMWANLLVSSAENYGAHNVYYVRLISQMSSMQARIFEAMIGPQGPGGIERGMEMIYFSGHDFIAELINHDFKEIKVPINTVSRAWKQLIKSLNMQGVVIEHIDVGHISKRDDYTSGCPTYSIYIDSQQNDYAILRGLGLIEYIDTGYFEVNNLWKIKVLAHYVSSLGLAFAQACKVQAKGSRGQNVGRQR